MFEFFFLFYIILTNKKIPSQNKLISKLIDLLIILAMSSDEKNKIINFEIIDIDIVLKKNPIDLKIKSFKF